METVDPDDGGTILPVFLLLGITLGAAPPMVVRPPLGPVTSFFEARSEDKRVPPVELLLSLMALLLLLLPPVVEATLLVPSAGSEGRIISGLIFASATDEDSASTAALVCEDTAEVIMVLVGVVVKRSSCQRLYRQTGQCRALSDSTCPNPFVFEENDPERSRARS